MSSLCVSSVTQSCYKLYSSPDSGSGLYAGEVEDEMLQIIADDHVKTLKTGESVEIRIGEVFLRCSRFSAEVQRYLQIRNCTGDRLVSMDVNKTRLERIRHMIVDKVLKESKEKDKGVRARGLEVKELWDSWVEYPYTFDIEYGGVNREGPSLSGYRFTYAGSS
jgi:hypothetical protein